MHELGILEEHQTVHDLFGDDGESTVPLAGESLMEVPYSWRRQRGAAGGEGLFSQSGDDIARDPRSLSHDDVRTIEKELEQLSSSIMDEWNLRQNQNAFEESVSSAFSKPFDWGEDQTIVEAKGSDATVSGHNTVKMRDLLTAIHTKLPQATADKFEIDELLGGYSSYIKTKTLVKKMSERNKDNEIYEKWYKECVGISDSHLAFSKFFQNLQIRTSSEAMAETVGSIMNNHSGKERYLDPVNFSKEIYLKFNLGPLFMMEDVIQAVYDLKNKEYIYKRKASGALSTHFSLLADHVEGSAIKAYRETQVKKAHLPVKLWK